MLVTIGPLSIKIVERANSQSNDFWDANWLIAVIQYNSSDINIMASGPIFHLSELEQWLQRLKRLSRLLYGEAVLECLEPYLRITLSAVAPDSILGKGTISEDPHGPHHDFEFKCPLMTLGKLIDELNEVLKAYPFIGDGTHVKKMLW